MIPIKPMMRLKENLKLLMECKGLKASQLARLSGVPSQRISDWTGGSTVRNLDQLKKVCQALEVDLDTILFSENPVVDKSKGLLSTLFDVNEEQTFEVKVKRINRNK